jgi:H+/gluconate symporter-like permease
MTTIINFISAHKKQIVCATIIAILACVGIYFYLQHVKTAQEAVQVIKYEDTTDQDKIKKDLAVDSTTASQIVKEIQYIHDGTTTPTVTYYVQSPTVEKAAEQTADAINKNDTALPAAATEKTDRTIVTANTDQQKVDVYKINLRNNHKIKAGILYADNKAYAGVGYQAGMVEAMIYLSADGKKAGAVNYTVREW